MLRTCLYCRKSFPPSPYNPQQRVCSHRSCQYQRRQQSRQAQLARDDQYRLGCQESRQQWRQEHAARYMRQYRQHHPEYRARNRQLQRERDRRRQLRNLVKNNAALDLKSASQQVFLIAPQPADLVKNNSAFSAKVLIVQTFPSLAPQPAAFL